MNHKLNILGLALIAALALSAVAAASASAVTHKFNAGANPTHLTAAAEPGEAGHQVFEATTGEHKASICTKVEVTGTVENPPVEKVTVEPQYEECGLYQTKEVTPEACEEPGKGTETNCTEKLAAATVVNNGCHYTFFGKTAKGNMTNEEEHADVAIESTLDAEKNPVCTHIEIKATALKLKCISVPAGQTIEHAVRYNEQETENKTKDITVEATAHGIESTTTNSVACPVGETPHTNGSYTGAVSVTGFSDSEHKNSTDLTLQTTE